MRGHRRTGNWKDVTNAGADIVAKPTDHIGTRTFKDHDGSRRLRAGARLRHQDPGCDTPGRMFVGQRRSRAGPGHGSVTWPSPSMTSGRATPRTPPPSS